MNSENKPKIAVPHVPFKAVIKVVNALFSSKRPGSAKAIAKLANLNETNTSKALSNAQSLGLVVRVKRGTYELSKDGKEFSRQIESGKDDNAKRIMRKLIFEREEWKEIVIFLKANVGKNRDPLDMVLHVESQLDKQWTSSVRKKMVSDYRSILSFADLIDGKEKKLVPNLEFDDDRTIEPGEGEEIATDDEHIDVAVSEGFYATYALPNIFTLRVRNTRKSLEFIKSQVQPKSHLAEWIDLILDSQEEEE